VGFCENGKPGEKSGVTGSTKQVDAKGTEETTGSLGGRKGENGAIPLSKNGKEKRRVVFSYSKRPRKEWGVFGDMGPNVSHSDKGLGRMEKRRTP